jgi:hypothetical protein
LLRRVLKQAKKEVRRPQKRQVIAASQELLSQLSLEQACAMLEVGRGS